MGDIVRIDYITPKGRKLVVRRDADGLVSGTDMGNHYGKQVGDWLRLQEITDLVERFSETTGIPVVNLVRKTEGRYGGTWLHQSIAWHYAYKLDRDVKVAMGQALEEKLAAAGGDIMTPSDFQHITFAERRMAELGRSIGSVQSVLPHGNEDLKAVVAHIVREIRESFELKPPSATTSAQQAETVEYTAIPDGEGLPPKPERPAPPSEEWAPRPNHAYGDPPEAPSPPKAEPAAAPSGPAVEEPPTVQKTLFLDAEPVKKVKVTEAKGPTCLSRGTTCGGTTSPGRRPTIRARTPSTTLRRSPASPRWGSWTIPSSWGVSGSGSTLDSRLCTQPIAPPPAIAPRHRWLQGSRSG